MTEQIFNVFDNFLKDEMNHSVVVGKAGSGKTELLTQTVMSSIKDGMKVLWLSSVSSGSLLHKLNPHIHKNGKEITKDILMDSKLVILNGNQVDYNFLKTLLINTKEKWLIVHDEINSLNEQSDEGLIDFLFFITELGNVFGLYALVASQDYSLIYGIHAMRKIFENSKTKIYLAQNGEKSYQFYREVLCLNESQIDKIKKLELYSAYVTQEKRR